MPDCPRCDGTGFEPPDVDDPDERTYPCQSCRRDPLAPSGRLSRVGAPDPAAVMAAHYKVRGVCIGCVRAHGGSTDLSWPCEPYLLAGDVMLARGERDAEKDRADRLAEALARCCEQLKIERAAFEGALDHATEALAAEKAKVARVEALADKGAALAPTGTQAYVTVYVLRAALADQPKQTRPLAP